MTLAPIDYQVPVSSAFPVQDDNAETIKERLQTFQKQSLPIVEYYSKRGKLKRYTSPHPLEANAKSGFNALKWTVNSYEQRAAGTRNYLFIILENEQLSSPETLFEAGATGCQQDDGRLCAAASLRFHRQRRSSRR